MKKKKYSDKEIVKILNDLFGCGNAWLRNKGCRDISNYNLGEIIMHSFGWDEAPEGSYYWNDLHSLMSELTNSEVI